MPVDLTKTTRRRGHYLPLLPQITRTRTATTRRTTTSAIKDFIVHLLPPHNRCWSAGSSPGERAAGRMRLVRRRVMGGRREPNEYDASAYGAASSLVIVAVWVYYSAQILLFGAEFTKV